MLKIDPVVLTFSILNLIATAVLFHIYFSKYKDFNSMQKAVYEVISLLMIIPLVVLTHWEFMTTFDWGTYYAGQMDDPYYFTSLSWEDNQNLNEISASIALGSINIIFTLIILYVYKPGRQLRGEAHAKFLGVSGDTITKLDQSSVSLGLSLIIFILSGIMDAIILFGWDSSNQVSEMFNITALLLLFIPPLNSIISDYKEYRDRGGIVDEILIKFTIVALLAYIIPNFIAIILILIVAPLFAGLGLLLCLIIVSIEIIYIKRSRYKW